MGFAHRKHGMKTRRLTQLNFNKTGFSNLYKFMTIVKSEIYTNQLLISKTIFLPKFKKMVLAYNELFGKFISKVK